MVGTVSNVEPGRSRRFGDANEGDSAEVVPFNDESADTSTIHLTVQVSSSITDGEVADPGETVRVGIAVDAPVDVDAAREEFEGYGTMAFLLYEGSDVFAYDRDLWPVMEDGSFFASIDESGTLAFPALDSESGHELAPPGLTRGDLEEPDTDEPIPLVTVNGEIVRR